MTDDSPLRRSIGLSGAIRFFVAVAAAIAIGAALFAGQYRMAIGLVVFLAVAVALGLRAWRAR